MKNEKIILNRPWISDIPKFTEENAVDHNDYRWTYGAPTTPTCFYASTFEIDDLTHLEIMFYVENQPLYRMIFSETDYIGQRADAIKASDAGIEHLEQYQVLNRWYQGSRESTRAICEYFKWKFCFDPIQKVRKMIKQTKEQKLKERHDKIRKSVDDVMLEIKPLPKDFESWVSKVPLRKSKYIFYNFAKTKRVSGICSECHNDVTIIRPRNGQTGICPNCKAKVTFKAAGTAGRIIDDAFVALVQSIKDGYVIRYFRAYKYYYNCTHEVNGYWRDINAGRRDPQIRLYEYSREFEGDHRKYFYWQNFMQTGERRFCRMDHLSVSNRSYLYGKNCKDVFSGERGNRKYFPFSYFCNHAPPLDVAEFLKNIIRIPQLEYMAKAKLYSLAAEIANEQYRSKSTEQIMVGKRLWESLNIAKDYMPLIRKEDMNLSQIRIFAATIRFGLDQAIMAKRWLEKQERGYWNTDRFIEVIKYTTPMKGIKYMESQRHLIKAEKHMYRTFRYATIFDIQREWIDYLEAAEKLGYDLKNSFVLFPQHLAEAHDEMTNQRLALEKKIKENSYAEIERIAPALNKEYGMKSNEFFIRAPRNYQELTKEGQELHHCVGTYAMRQAMRETTILLIRRIEDPDKPYYTLEYKDGRVEQVRGMKNCGTTPEVQRFVDGWAKKIAQKEEQKQRVLATVAV